MTFLSLPCRSSSDVDIKKPISRFIDKTYGSKLCSTVSSSLDKLQDMRKSTVMMLKTKSKKAVTDIATYHDTLYLLESRVAMSESEARVDWKWMDITGKTKKVCSSAFERANLIFCYGAMNSQLAESANLKDADGLKDAVLALKAATGAFNYLASNVYMFGSSGDQLLTDTLNAYATVMYGQAQECLYLKAEGGQFSSAMIAKLASAIRETYEDGFKRCTASGVKHYVPKDWSETLATKTQFFAAVSEYHQSKNCGDSRAFGERITRLKQAHDVLKAIPKNFNLSSRQTLLDQCKRELESATKENNCIYHMSVPSVKELSSIPAESPLKRMPLELPISKGEVKDLFSALVPLGVLEAKNQAEVIYRSLIGAETHRLRDATSALNAIMTSMNLPAAVQLNSDGGGFETLFGSIGKIREEGGVEQLRQHVFSLPESAQRNRDILLQQQKTLDDEEAADMNLKQQFGDKWTRKPSSELNHQWRRDIEKMLNFLVETEKTDETLLNRFKQHEECFDMFSKSDSELLASLKAEQGNTVDRSSGSDSGREEVARACSAIETLKADRNSLCDQLEALKLSDDIVQQLLELYKSNQQVTEQNILDILNNELEGSRECVRASEKKQEELLGDLQVKYEAFFGSSTQQEAPNSNALLTRLTTAVNEFPLLSDDVKEGMSFYATLTDRCLIVQGKIDDFCLARTTEKTEHMADITINLGRVTVSDGPSAPPAISSTAPARPAPTYQNPAPPPQPTPQPAHAPPPLPTPQPTQAPPQLGPPGVAAGMPGMPQPGYGWIPAGYPYGMPGYAPQQPQQPGPGMPYYGYYPMPPAQMPPYAGMQPPPPSGQMPPPR